jgi:ABC-type Fe3+ transport system substrate-binding protein
MLTSLKDGPVAAFILAGAGVVGAIVLTALNKTVPTELWALTSALLGGGLGITNPSASASTTTPVMPVDQAGGASQ